jgi:DNA-directed RNA polymerase specialized sigma24 family protein
MCKEFKFEAATEMAEEFTQDAFLKMIESDFVDQDKTYAWLETVVDNLILSHSRRLKI